MINMRQHFYFCIFLFLQYSPKEQSSEPNDRAMVLHRKHLTWENSTIRYPSNTKLQYLVVMVIVMVIVMLVVVLVLISLATNMLESWYTIHWKGGIHSFVRSTNTFLYDIREPRYRQIKMGYQISKCLSIGQSQCLEI